MSWTLFASVSSTSALYDSWTAEIYKNTTSTLTTRTYTLLSDMKLTRGSASRKDKFGGFTFTAVTFTLRDYQHTLFDTLSGADDSEFKAIIKKNGSVFFVGNVVLMTSKKDVTLKNSPIQIKVYDGLKRLKNFDDFSALVGLKRKINEVLYDMLGSVGFGIDIHLYSRIWKGSTSAGSEFPGESQLLYFEDYLSANPTATYYDILDYLTKQLNLEIFQASGVWVVRQIVSINFVTATATDGITKVVIDGATGHVTKSVVSLNQAITSSDLAGKPVTYQGNKYERISYANKYNEVRRIGMFELYSFDDTKQNQFWENPQFEKDRLGWTTVSGSPKFKNKSLMMNHGDEVKQLSAKLNGSEKVRISAIVDCSRMVLQSSEILNHFNYQGTTHDNPLFQIIYKGDSNNYYFFAPTWADADVNGDFETGDLTGWSTGGSNTLAIESTEIHGGSYSGKAVWFDDDVLFANSFTYTKDGNVEASVWVKGDTGQGIECRLYDGAGSYESVRRTLTGDWQQISVSLYSHTAASASFQILRTESKYYTVYADDLVVQEKAASASDYEFSTTAPNPDGKFGVPLAGVYGTSLWDLLEIYSVATFKFEQEITIPAEAGYLEIHLYGGGTASGNDYPGEFGACHRKFDAELVSSTDSDDTNPSEFHLDSTLGSYAGSFPASVKSIDIPFHDLDAYGNSSFWFSAYDSSAGTTVYSRTIRWTTPWGEKPLTEALASLLLGYHQNIQCFDVKLLPNTSGDYNNVFYGDLDGGGKKYFLPVYEETNLIDADKRFVLIQHELAAEVVAADESFYASSFGTAVSLHGSPIQEFSERVKSTSGATIYTRDTDYEMDYTNGTITLLSSGSMSTSTTYLIDYFIGTIERYYTG